ncbi:hypothetical protein AG1IA_02140 [Rhizoctonia solani AG-1 IA]|uniref:Uncharacterized protein n=1 Tax=Thanatephorus cucumeris (strain AG1-IA) TaxID=983506 RepID=L8X492_THACA|nr:hypothetical protein AG1IA_02140 [Rhizoctonia solani AG-1 IA]
MRSDLNRKRVAAGWANCRTYLNPRAEPACSLDSFSFPRGAWSRVSSDELSEVALQKRHVAN